MTMGERIRALRERQGLTQQALAARLGVSNKAVSAWEKGSCAPRMCALQALADCLGVRVGEIVDGPELLPVRRKRVRLLGAAGERASGAIEIARLEAQDEPIECDCALRVEGDAMEPTLRDGDLALVRAGACPAEGGIAAVELDGRALARRLYRAGDGWLLCCDCAGSHPPRAVAELKLLGSVVGVQRRL